MSRNLNSLTLIIQNKDKEDKEDKEDNNFNNN